jgi:hypothetical protein
MQPVSSEHGLVDAINAVEVAMKAQFSEVRWSFFEPDVAD